MLTWLASQMLMNQPPLKAVLEESCPACIRCSRSPPPPGSVVVVTALQKEEALSIYGCAGSVSQRVAECACVRVCSGELGAAMTGDLQCV